MINLKIKKLFNFSQSRGFTLIELLIYISILAVVLTFTSEFLYAIGQAKINGSARNEVAQNGQFIINKLAADLAEATIISTPGDINPTNNLVFTQPADNTVIYAIGAGNIVRSDSLGVFNLNSNQVQISNLTFQKITSPGEVETIQLKFTITSQSRLSGNRVITENFQTTVSRR